MSSSANSTVATWQFMNVRTEKWIDLPRRTCVIMEKHYSNVSGGKPCVIEHGDAEYRIDFENQKAVDTRNYHKWLQIRRLEHGSSGMEISPKTSSSSPMQLASQSSTPAVDHRPEFPVVTREIFADDRMVSADSADAPTCKLYVVRMSPNCIGPWILLNEGNVIHDLVDIDLSKGETKTPQFLALNPLHQVPVLCDEDGTVVFESNAILRYICNTFSVDDMWYPIDGKERAKCEMALDWRQTTLIPAILKALGPALGHSNDLSGVAAGKEALNEQLHILETFWLRGSSFICGSRPSIADISVAVPLLLLDVSMKVSPAILAYIQRFSQQVSCWDEVTLALRQYVNSKKH